MNYFAWFGVQAKISYGRMACTLFLICGLMSFCSLGENSFAKAVIIDDDEIRLHQYLFANYTRVVRPVRRNTEAVTVKLGITIHQVVALVEKTQILQTSVWIRQTWNNPLLTWNPEDFGGIDRINVEAKKVWVPDIYLYNNADNENDGALNKFSTHIKLQSNGQNIWLAPVLLTSSCKIDVTYFPFDEQRCQLKFGSWTYDGLRLDLVSESPSGDLSKYVKNGEWDMLSFLAKRNEILYVCCPEPYPDVTFTLHMRRKATYYYVNLIMPCFLITGLTILSFVLPPDSGERITLVITNLLSMTVFMLLVAEVLPATSEVVPIISIYYCITLFEVGLALVATCVVLRIYFTNPVTTEMPNWVRIVVLKWMARFFKIKVPGAIQEIKKEFSAEDKVVRQEMLRENEALIDFKKREERETERKMSITQTPYTSLLERRASFFPDEAPVYQPLDHLDVHRLFARERRPSIWSIHSEKLRKARQEPSVTDSEIGNAGGNEKPLDSGIGGSNTNNPLTPMMVCRQENIANNVRRLVKMARSKEEEEIKREEWKVVAEIIDKFLLWVFMSMLLTSSFVVFIQTPRYSISSDPKQ